MSPGALTGVAVLQTAAIACIGPRAVPAAAPPISSSRRVNLLRNALLDAFTSVICRPQDIAGVGQF
jgi:hypothetical protein